MDPFSTESELFAIQSHFQQGQYASVVSYDTSSLSPENHLAANVLVLRAKIALGQAEEVLAETDGAEEPELQAVGALALSETGKAEEAAAKVEELVGGHGENATVQVLGGIVLFRAGNGEEALAVLGKHEGNLEAVALIVQIHLAQNRNDLALKEVSAARRWAQDNLLVNLAEAWVGLRLGGERYQQSFYVFEELAQAPSTSSARTLVSQAVAELHLGRLEEAESALEQAVKAEPQNADAIANLLVLSVISGKDAAAATENLKAVDPSHAFLTDLEEKSALFDKAAQKFSAKVSA
ncbi:related to coatomer epsilon subunit [Cephalotrichum gorgonifer]|uniref:Coatomer subunit epsilon n=1 Tax=Cephalotrichum gorgonifer TaxID=2041049 RepID=A0AAE8SSM1_9PEZI|nr:related to coatomer epsilon subunit [Cephalotrichum gorgonifer]